MIENVESVIENAAPSRQKHKPKLRAATGAAYVMLALYLILIFAPFVIIVFTSFTSDYELTNRGGFALFPKEWSVEGYELVFKFDPNIINGIPSLLVGFFNTMWQTLIPTLGGLFTSALAAFIYSKFRFPGRKLLFLITVLTMMLPMGAFGFVSYLFYMKIGWVGGARGILPLIIPGLFGSASMVFFLRAYFDSALANEVLEAARMDGAGNFRSFFYIVIPLAKPALIAQFLFGFVGGYNSYGGALMYLYNTKELWNLQLALSELVLTLSREGGGYGNAQCASALVAIIPLLLLYVCVQKYFIEGINIGGGKE
ncbi:MAG: carbohydrate ABC transporter permease [Christensenellaceae bacterium]